jgi:hypothetical protein
MDPQTVKLIGAVAIAIINAMPDETRAETCGTILRASEDPDRDLEGREFLRAIHHAAT